MSYRRGDWGWGSEEKGKIWNLVAGGGGWPRPRRRQAQSTLGLKRPLILDTDFYGISNDIGSNTHKLNSLFYI